MEQALTISILAVLVTMALALIRAFMGPSAYNRMLAANMFGTKTVLLVALGGLLLGWPSFVDIALLYAMVNFVFTVAVMRFFEYDECADRPEGAATPHPWVAETRGREAAALQSGGSQPRQGADRAEESPKREDAPACRRPPSEGGANR